jgi:hypothetical protein
MGLPAFVVKYLDKYVNDSDIEAVTETSKNHNLGTFLVQYCSPGENDYTAHFHSRVVFA